MTVKKSDDLLALAEIHWLMRKNVNKIPGLHEKIQSVNDDFERAKNKTIFRFLPNFTAEQFLKKD